MWLTHQWYLSIYCPQKILPRLGDVGEWSVSMVPCSPKLLLAVFFCWRWFDDLSPCHYGCLFPWSGLGSCAFLQRRKTHSSRFVTGTSTRPLSRWFSPPFGWAVFFCYSAPIALFAHCLSILMSALFLHLPGTYYVEALLVLDV